MRLKHNQINFVDQPLIRPDRFQRLCSINGDLIAKTCQASGRFYFTTLKLIKQIIAWILLLSAISLTISCKKQERPNIIIILSDDMGYSDLGCFGSEIRTPNLDALAANGLRFTQFYNTSRCCPSRASLLTGLYPHQAGIGNMVKSSKVDQRSEKADTPGYLDDLSENCVTIAQVLKQANYQTYAVGKWHVSANIRPDGAKYNWPLQRGFDKFYGTISGANSYWDPLSLTRDNTMITPENDLEYKPDTYYYTDAISDNAVTYIQEHEDSSPFFMYVAYTAAHWPLHAPESEIDKYKGVYDKGWDYIRQQRFNRLQELGLIDEDWALSPAENTGWENVEDKDWMTRRMMTYAAMVDIMDQGIGRIVASLKEKGKLDNTLIFFLHDNGGCAEDYFSSGSVIPADWEEMPLQPMDDDELQMKMRPDYTRDGRPIVQGEGIMPGLPDTYTDYGQEWANVSNTPFRLYKKWSHEGGISTPMIVSWPDGFQAKGELRNQPSHLIDLMTTCVEAANASYPESFNNKAILPMEGKSLIPAFQNQKIPRDYLLFEHIGNRAIRVEDWKLVYQKERTVVYENDTTQEGGKWELYNLANDRTELHDLAADYPEKAKELEDLWFQEAKRTYIIDEKHYND